MTARVRRYSDAADLITELAELIKAVQPSQAASE